MSAWVETDRGPACADCWHGCPRPAHWAACDRDGCCCPCRDRDGGRARELDDRPATALESVSRDLAAEMASPVAFATERAGLYRRLYAERFHPRGV